MSLPQPKHLPTLPPRCDFYLQIKSAVWGGVFIDVHSDEEIPEKSLVNVLRKSKEVQIHSKIHQHCLEKVDKSLIRTCKTTDQCLQKIIVPLWLTCCLWMTP